MEQPYVYQTIHEVPEPWRTFRGGRANVAQVNAMMARAYQLGAYCTDAEGNQAGFVPNFALAREEFVASHVIVNGFWAVKAEG